jgi:hypothetical protein
MKLEKDNEKTIKTMGESVRLYEDSLKAFIDQPDGENFKDMDFKQKQMFLTCRICLQVTFPDTDDIDIKDAIRIANDIKIYKEHQESIKVI